MTTQPANTTDELTNEATVQNGFPVPFTLEQFQKDVRWLFYLQLLMIESMTDTQTALRMIGKSAVDGHVCLDWESIPTELDFSYGNIRHTPFAQSLEAMYRYAYHGEVDDSIERLGPGGYHIVIAAIVNDLARSSLVNFWAVLAEGSGQESVKNCLRTAELANARLVLEGEERFFNFDGKDEGFDSINLSSRKDWDYASLLNYEAAKEARDGYGATLTVRQLAMLAGMEEMTIRTAANPRRARYLPTVPIEGRTLFAIGEAKAWLQEKGRYVPIKYVTDGGLLDLARRRFVDMNDLISVVLRRLTVLDGDLVRKAQRMVEFIEIGNRYGITPENRAAFANPDFVREVADMAAFPPELFALRVKEVLLDEELTAVRREVMDTVQKSNS